MGFALVKNIYNSENIICVQKSAIWMSLSSYINNISDFKAYAKCEKVRPASYRTSLDSGNLFYRFLMINTKYSWKTAVIVKKLPTLEIISIGKRWHQTNQKYNFPFLNNKLTFAQEHFTIFSWLPGCLWLDTVLKIYDLIRQNIMNFWAAYINP